MNQSQLIDIIGNRDVVTVIQSYMSGNPLIPDDDDDVVEDVQKSIKLCKFMHKLKMVLRGKLDDNYYSFNYNTQIFRRILKIPDVEKQPIYALMFKLNGDRDLFHRLISVEAHMNLRFSTRVFTPDPTPKKLSLLVKWKKMQYVVTELRAHGYVFEIRDISNSWYKKHDY